MGASSFVRPLVIKFSLPMTFSRDKFYQALPFPFDFSFARGESLGTRPQFYFGKSATGFYSV